MEITKLKNTFSTRFLFLGWIFVISPIVLLWLIHGSYERYIWIINGPYPLSSFGSGPFQLFISIGLFLIGVLFLIISDYLRKRRWNK